MPSPKPDMKSASKLPRASAPLAISEEDRATYLEAFADYDADNDGKLAREQLYLLLEGVSLFVTPDMFLRKLDGLGMKKQMQFNAEDVLKVIDSISGNATGEGVRGSGTIAVKAADDRSSPAAGLRNAISRFASRASLFSQGAMPQFAGVGKKRIMPKGGAAGDGNVDDDDDEDDDSVSDYSYYSYGSDSENDTTPADAAEAWGDGSPRAPQAKLADSKSHPNGVDSPKPSPTSSPKQKPSPDRARAAISAPSLDIDDRDADRSVYPDKKSSKKEYDARKGSNSRPRASSRHGRKSQSGGGETGGSSTMASRLSLSRPRQKVPAV